MRSGGASEDKGGDLELGPIGARARGLQLSSLSQKLVYVRGQFDQGLEVVRGFPSGQFILDGVGKTLQKAHCERLVVPATRCCHCAELDGCATLELGESQELFG